MSIFYYYIMIISLNMDLNIVPNNNIMSLKEAQYNQIFNQQISQQLEYGKISYTQMLKAEKKLLCYEKILNFFIEGYQYTSLRIYLVIFFVNCLTLIPVINGLIFLPNGNPEYTYSFTLSHYIITMVFHTIAFITACLFILMHEKTFRTQERKKITRKKILHLYFLHWCMMIMKSISLISDSIVLLTINSNFFSHLILVPYQQDNLILFFGLLVLFMSCFNCFSSIFYVFVVKFFLKNKYLTTDKLIIL
jgi:hypothetical protein